MTVFISHSFDNRPEFDNVTEALERASVTYWAPTEIKSAASLRDQLRSAIGKCSVCVYIATRRSVESSWCGAELGAFWGAGIPIIVYLAEASLSEDLLPPIVQGDVWERRLSRVADRAKELDAARKDVPGAEEVSRSARLTNMTAGQLELLLSRMLATAQSGAAEISQFVDGPVAWEEDRSAQLSDRQRQLVEDQPPNWEYLLWSATLEEGKAGLEGKWQRHVDKTLVEPGMVLNRRTIRSFPSELIATLQDLIKEVNALFSSATQEQALGAPGEPGSSARIIAMGEELLTIYSKMMDWSARVRGAEVEEKYSALAQIGASVTDVPIENIRGFIEQLAESMRQVEQGETDGVHITLKLDLDSDVLGQFLEEYEKVM